MKNHTPGADEVLGAIQRNAVDFDNPPELTDEVKKIRAIKQVARQNIISRGKEYVETPLADRPAKKYLLAEIQQICDELDDAFVLVVPQKDGVPYSITFNPHTPEPVDPSNSPSDSLDTPAS